ncbi:hypothetical protein [Snuella sedimenti]|uniref:Anti-sigma factor n=1 Tax=Snuella sedimenti TaxID=2798802 RepID=A0A8J7LNH3_9FLAO|nr:hypothetical protein [Snuella sedimenti]MBJ6367918.1 hypothetical protein [Snuella sedimenti]
MARDIRELFKEGAMSLNETMPDNHQERFLEKLNKALPEEKKYNYSWIKIAASIVLFLGVGFGAYNFFQPNKNIPVTEVDTTTTLKKTLGDISPGLKKVEDYYLASINLELSKIKFTAENKELFDGYLTQLGELDKEYNRLSVELTKSGPSELTINALIDNLKYRLNLLYRLREQVKDLNNTENGAVSQAESI